MKTAQHLTFLMGSFDFGFHSNWQVIDLVHGGEYLVTDTRN